MSRFTEHLKLYLHKAALSVDDVTVHTPFLEKPAKHSKFKLEEFEDTGIVLGKSPTSIVRACKWHGKLVAVKLLQAQDDFLCGSMPFVKRPVSAVDMEVDVPSYTSPADVEELVSAQLTAFSEAINGTTYTYGHQNVLSTRGMLTASPAYYLKYPMLASRLQETNGTAPLVLGVVMEAATSGCVNNMLEYMHDYGYLVALDEYRAALLAACIGYQACSGVAALQERGLLVVDIKPNNLLISCWGGPEGLSELTVKVADLGSSAPVDESGAAYYHGVPGTMGFQSPEMMTRVDEQGRFILLHSDDGPGVGMTLALLLLREAKVQMPASLRDTHDSPTAGSYIPSACGSSQSSSSMGNIVQTSESAAQSLEGLATGAGIYISDDVEYNAYCARLAADPLAFHRHYSQRLRPFLLDEYSNPIGAALAHLALRLMGPESARPTIAQARDELAQYADGWSRLMSNEVLRPAADEDECLLDVPVDSNAPDGQLQAAGGEQAGSNVPVGKDATEPSSSSMPWQAELPYEAYPDNELEYDVGPAYEPYSYIETHLMYYDPPVILDDECQLSSGSETDADVDAVSDADELPNTDVSPSEVCSTSCVEQACGPKPAAPLTEALSLPLVYDTLPVDMDTASASTSSCPPSPACLPLPAYTSAEPQPAAAAWSFKPCLMVLLPGDSPAVSPIPGCGVSADLSTLSPSSPPSTSSTPCTATCASLSPPRSSAAASSHSSPSPHPSSPTFSLASSMGSILSSAQGADSMPNAWVSFSCMLYECSWPATQPSSSAVCPPASSPSLLVRGGRLLVLSVLLAMLAGTLACMGVVVAGVLVVGGFIMLGGCMLVMWMLAACTAGLLLLLLGMHAGWACLAACCGWLLDSNQGGSRTDELQNSWAHTASRLHQFIF